MLPSPYLVSPQRVAIMRTDLLAPPTRRGPGGGGMTVQMLPVGPHPDVDVLSVGALLWSSPHGAAELLALVRDDDIESPALAAVLAAVRTLARAEKPFGPQLVLDELRRSGALSAAVAEQLKMAMTCGADPVAVRHYFAALVADSLRRRVASAGVALSSAAWDGAEADLAPFANQAAATVADCAPTAGRTAR
jgi:hypothetical protein